MVRLIPLFLVLLLPCQSLAAFKKSVTLYLDGARVEMVGAAANGYLEFPLPDSMQPGSLRVAPLEAGSILRVETAAALPDRASAARVARLEARKGALEDRLQGLAAREEIFSAAARSQSGKSAKKSKNNPEPLAALREGTEFALGQLDAVYRSRRRCASELKEVEAQLARARKAGSRARVWFQGRRVKLSYLTAAQSWTPCYSFRAAGEGSCELSLHAKLPAPEKGVRYLVAPGALASGAAALKAEGALTLLSRQRVTLRQQSYSDTPYPALTLAFTGAEGDLPPGEAMAFWHGAYVGSSRFNGGREGELTFGR